MKQRYTILIADRNPHVRAFLKREMEAEGYRVELAESRSKVMRMLLGNGPVHLFIMDPDLPDANGMDIIERAHDRIPALPVILHSFSATPPECSALGGKTVFVENGGGSIENLKNVAAEILKKIDVHHLEVQWRKWGPKKRDTHES
ncbi:MAG: response regulator [Deltaproteobacteria bacterium]